MDELLEMCYEQQKNPVEEFLEFSSNLEGKITPDAMEQIKEANSIFRRLLEKKDVYVDNASGHIRASLIGIRKNESIYVPGSEQYNLLTRAINHLGKIRNATLSQNNQIPNLE